MGGLLREGCSTLREDGVVGFLGATAAYLRWRSEVAKTWVSTPIADAYYDPPADPVRIMDEDWDNLLILDACRYDLFAEANFLDGDLTRKVSQGSATPEFLDGNFDGELHHDTVYVTANPMHRTRDRELESVFHAVVDVWEDDWDAENNTVLPEAMAEATVKAQAEFPHKRILSHFMQPHYPFIGDEAAQIGDHAGSEKVYGEVTGGDSRRDAPTVWSLLEEGRASKPAVWAAYRENLELVLAEIERIAPRLSGKTVISSDHGNLLGERLFPFGPSYYGHPAGLKHEHLCEVPWLVLPFESRTEIRAEQPSSIRDEPSGEVSERLADLGYVDAT